MPTPTPGELEILKVLWEQGRSSVQNVYANHPRVKELRYNTVQTLLRIMEDKELVRHEVEGRTFIYIPCYSRDESAVRFLDRVFDGMVEQLVMSLVRAERITSGEIERMQAMIAEARQSRATNSRTGRKLRTTAGE